MISRRYRTVPLRRALALAACVAVPSIPLFLVAACAESDGAEAPKVDDRVVVPASDSGAEASLDGSADADAPGVDSAVPCAVGNLCNVPTPLTVGSVAAMSGRSKNDVWASASGGLLMRWDGQQWSALESNSNETITTIFLTPDEMLGASGTLVIRRGLDASSIRTARLVLWFAGLSRSVASIAVLPNGEEYVALAPGMNNYSPLYFVELKFAEAQIGFQPDALHPVTNEPQSRLGARALFLVPNKALWLVGDQAAVVRYPVSPPVEDEDGGASEDGGDAGGTGGGAPLLGQGVVVPVASQANLLAAWGYGEHLWAAGESGTILHFDGVEWSNEDTGTKVAINAIYGLSPNDIWAAGDDGTVLHFDGNVWSPLNVGGYRGKLTAVWGSAADDVWIGGEGGMFHWGALR